MVSVQISGFITSLLPPTVHLVQINPAFHHGNIEPMETVFARRCGGMLKRLQVAAATGAVIDIHAHFMQLTLDVIGETAFGMEFAAQTDSPSLVARLLAKIPDGNTSTSGLKWKPEVYAALRTVNDALLPIVRQRMVAIRENGGVTVPKDLLSLLVSAKDPVSGEQMSEEQVMAEVRTFLAAGE